jgi:hypothetical protein
VIESGWVFIEQPFDDKEIIDERKEKGTHMRKSAVCAALLLFVILPLSAQSNELLDRLLDQPKAQFGDVVYMTMVAAKLLPETATPQEALQALQQQNWKVAALPLDAPIPLGTYSFLLMKAFKFGGGILYTLFPGPRYACRELGYLKIIPTDVLMNRSVSGEEAMAMLGKVMERTGGGL